MENEKRIVSTIRINDLTEDEADEAEEGKLASNSSTPSSFSSTVKRSKAANGMLNFILQQFQSFQWEILIL